jgi:hypothetical protein
MICQIPLKKQQRILLEKMAIIGVLRCCAPVDVIRLSN